MHEQPGKRFQFGLASLFAAMTLAALVAWADSLWPILAIWVATYLCGLIAIAVLVVIVRLLAWAGMHIAPWVRKPRQTW